MNNLRKEIAKAIRQERKYFGYSTKSVSAFLGINWHKYIKMEKGEEPITIGHLYKIAQLYGLNVEYFIDKEYHKRFKKGRGKVCWCRYGEECK